MGIVKQLVWEEDEPGWWTAESPAVRLSYEVRVSGSGKTRVRMPGGEWGYFDGLPAQAMDACQTDYATRVEECLDYEPEEAPIYLTPEERMALQKEKTKHMRQALDHIKDRPSPSPSDDQHTDKQRSE